MCIFCLVSVEGTNLFYVSTLVRFLLIMGSRNNNIDIIACCVGRVPNHVENVSRPINGLVNDTA